MSTEPFDPEVVIEEGLAQLAETKRAIDKLSVWLADQPDPDAAVTAIVTLSTVLLSKPPSDQLRDRTLARANILLRYHYGLEIDDGGAMDRLIDADPEALDVREERIEALHKRVSDMLSPEDNDGG